MKRLIPVHPKLTRELPERVGMRKPLVPQWGNGIKQLEMEIVEHPDAKSTQYKACSK